MQLVEQRDVKEARESRFDDGSTSRNTLFHRDAEGNQQGFLVELTGTLKAHFHHVRQFQVIVAGEGSRVGKVDTPPISFHYTDADSPYGPIVPGPSGSMAFFTLRARASKGVFYMPGSGEHMIGHAGRNLAVQVPAAPTPDVGVEIEQLVERHDDGLACYRLRLSPDAEATGPSMGTSGGRYYLLCGGSLLHEGRDVRPFALGWAAPDEPEPLLHGGSEGADVLVLQFPVLTEIEVAGMREEIEMTQRYVGEGPRVEHSEVVSL